MYIGLGLVIGFVAAIPLGPINVFVVSQTLKRDFLHGFLAGLTASLMDGAYCFIALVGLGHITKLLERYSVILKIVAAVILTAIGLRLIRQARVYAANRAVARTTTPSPTRPIFGVILLYVSNPTLYAFWLGVAGTVTTHAWVTHLRSQALLFSLACAVGSVLWYFLVVRYVARNHHLFSARTFRNFFLGMAILLFVFAAYGILSLAIPSLSGKI